MDGVPPEPRDESPELRRPEAGSGQPAGGSVLTPACVPRSAAPYALPLRRVHALGPLLRWVPLENPVTGRLYALAMVAGAVALFATAAHIHPGHQLVGTHQQLGLPPCGFLLVTGFPCPT